MPQPKKATAKKTTARRAPTTKPAPKPTRPAPKPDGLPILASGSAHPLVIVCARKLDPTYGTSPASRGEEAAGILGPEELAQFSAFRRAHGITEDASAFSGDQAAADAHVTPTTIAAVLAS